MREFVASLTAELASSTDSAQPSPRVVLSSGGAAGGVISEGQGYGLLLAATTVATLPLDDPQRTAAVEQAYQLFLGWRTMCERTALRRRRLDPADSACDCSWTGVGRANCGGSGDGSRCWKVCCGDGVAAADTRINASEPQPAYTSCQQPSELGCGRRRGATGGGGGEGGTASLCLPSWKFDDTVTEEVGTGSAPDGDEDAILGAIVLLSATQAAGTPQSHSAAAEAAAEAALAGRPKWWQDVLLWTYDSCEAFLRYDTAPHPTHMAAANGYVLRAVKLGSCWGGWDCANPSYYAPAHYRVFQAFMRAHAHLAAVPRSQSAPQASPAAAGSSPATETPVILETSGAHAHGAWEALIEASYSILGEAQCEETGLVPNWHVPSLSHLDEASAARARQQWAGWAPGRASCSGSGTSPTEFGAEASRAVWRVALDALWHGEPRAVAFSNAIASHAIGKLLLANASTPSPKPNFNFAATTQLEAPASCAGRVDRVHANWLRHGFMLGPVAAALMVPLPAGHPLAGGAQQAALDVAASLLGQMPIREYYPGSWTAIGTLTLAGAFPLLAPLLQAAASSPPAGANPAPEQSPAMSSGGGSPVPPTERTAEEKASSSGGSNLFATAGPVVFVLLLLLLGLGRLYARRQPCPPNGAHGLHRATEPEERQPLSKEEWTMHYDRRSGRPYWHNGTCSTFNKPTNLGRHLSSGLSPEPMSSSDE